GNQFQAVKSRFVRDCQKLTLTSASITHSYFTFNEIGTLRTIGHELRCLFKPLEHESDLESVENAGIEQLPSAETTEDFELPSVENVPDLTILPTNSEELLVEQSMDQQHSLGESDTVVKPSQ
ncbi:disease resistance protein (CC-NBS-LRR class) family protein, partial [Trifolium medium]|nr:disease resistance protein (CC-NBS-LRR class) family protein [Trifolium medium]